MRPSLPQVLKADRQVFLYLIRTGVDLKRQVSNTLELDEKIFVALQAYEVGFHLLPLLKSGQKADAPSAAAPPSHSNYQGGKGAQWPSNRSQPCKGKGGGAHGKGKGKSGQVCVAQVFVGT